MKPIDITGTVRDAFSIGIGKNKSEFGVFYGSLYFRNFEDTAWKKVASLQDISSSTKDFSWKSNTLYSVNALIEYNNVFYKCINEHQSTISFSNDLLEWQEIGFYGNLRLINLDVKNTEDFFYELSKFDDTVIIYGNNTTVNAPFKVYLPEKTKVNLNKMYSIQNASYNKVEIYYYNNISFINNINGDYVTDVKLINKSENDNNIGTWNSKYSFNRPISKISEWRVSETYRVNDTVRVGYFLYTCISNHTSNINSATGFNIDYENNRWIYSGGAYPGGTNGLSDKMPIDIRVTGSREVYQINMMGLAYKGNTSSQATLDFKNRRVISNSAPVNSPRSTSFNLSTLLSDLMISTAYKNKNITEVFRYVYKNYRPYEESSYSSAVKLKNGVPGKKYILLIKSDGGPYVFDSGIIFPAYGNSSNKAQVGSTADTGNWFSTLSNELSKKMIANGVTLANSEYTVEDRDTGLLKDDYKGNIFPVQSDPGKIDAFELICIDYSDQALRPGSADTFLARYIGSYNMGNIFPLRLTPSQPIIGGPGQEDGSSTGETYVNVGISALLLNGEEEIFFSVGEILDNLTIITSLVKGTNSILSLRLSYVGDVLADLTPNPNGGDEIFNTIYPFTLTVPGIIKIIAVAGDGKTTTLKEANMNFVYKSYWGFNSNETLTNEQILNLQYSALKNKVSGESYYFETNPDYDVSEYIYFCYPATYSDISYIEDPVAGFSYNSESFEKSVVDVTNEFDSVTQYKIYRTKVKTYGGNFTWRVNLI